MKNDFLMYLTQATRKKTPNSPNRSRTYDPLVTSPGALPLSYRKLVGAKAIKLQWRSKVVETLVKTVQKITKK